MATMADGYVQRLGRFLAQRREELRMSQEDLSKASGVPRGTIAAIENERVDNAPRLDTIERLARGLRVDPLNLVSVTLGLDTERAGKGISAAERSEYLYLKEEILSDPKAAEQLQQFLQFLEWQKGRH